MQNLDVPLLAAAEVDMHHVRRRPRISVEKQFIRQRELGLTNSQSPRALPGLLRWIERETLRRLDTGTYVELSRTPERVRSTISIAFSHDGKFFASTHGDHSVKVFEYPSQKRVACLNGHPHTPWSVRFHPHDSAIIASGCRGGECRIWNVKQRKTIRKHLFHSRISSVAFNPSGEFLAVTAGRHLHVWRFADPTYNSSVYTESPIVAVNSDTPPNVGNLDFSTAQGMPLQLLTGMKAFHMVDFHPSGRWLMTGESNRTPQTRSGEAQYEDQFTLRVVVHRFDRRTGFGFDQPVLVVPRVVAYNDAGVHFSPCGTRLAVCIPQQSAPHKFQIAVLALVKSPGCPVGSLLFSRPLSRGHVTALTNLKFSTTGAHLLAGFSFPRGNPVLRVNAEFFDFKAAHPLALAPCGAPLQAVTPQVHVVEIYRVFPQLPLIRSLGADIDMSSENPEGGAEDEINVAVFAPAEGLADGILYGTQKGRIRIFQHATGRKLFPAGVCDENCSFRRPQSYTISTLLHSTARWRDDLIGSYAGTLRSNITPSLVPLPPLPSLAPLHASSATHQPVLSSPAAGQGHSAPHEPTPAPPALPSYNFDYGSGQGGV